MSRNILVTGATGLLGSNLAYRFLTRGDRVCFLARGDEAVARRRLESAIKVIDPEFDLGGHPYQILSGDLRLPRCGIDRQRLAALRGELDEIWHSAASVNFSFENLEGTREVNVGGTRNVVELATELKSPDLHHVSTAYVAGFLEGVFLETDHRQDRLFKNAYEKTKLEGEHMVHGYGGRYSIYRPSVIVGESARGSCLTFTGYYRLFQVFNLIRSHVLRRLRRDPEALRASGVRLIDGRAVSLPVVVPCANLATLNLVPVDWVADTMIRLATREKASQKTFHITHPQPVSLRWVIETSCRVIGIEGLRFEDPKVLHMLLNEPGLVHDCQVVRNAQKHLIQWLNVYWPYFWREPVFDDTNVKSALNSSYVPPRVVNEGFVQTLIGYALAKGFKQKGAN